MGPTARGGTHHAQHWRKSPDIPGDLRSRRRREARCFHTCFANGCRSCRQSHAAMLGSRRHPHREPGTTGPAAYAPATVKPRPADRPEYRHVNHWRVTALARPARYLLLVRPVPVRCRASSISVAFRTPPGNSGPTTRSGNTSGGGNRIISPNSDSGSIISTYARTHRDASRVCFTRTRASAPNILVVAHNLRSRAVSRDIICPGSDVAAVGTLGSLGNSAIPGGPGPLAVNLVTFTP